MTGRVVAILPERFAASALIAALCTFGPGCSQLLGITGITAAADASTNDATGDGGSSNDTADNDAESAADRSSEDAPDTRSSNDGQTNADAISCTGDLSNVQAGDFLISFTMQTNQSDNFVSLVNQRAICVGLALFWDAMLENQHVTLELSESMDQTRYTFLKSSGAALNDNNPHDVVIARTNDVVTIVIDGQAAGSKTMDQKLGSLPTLRIGRDVCAGAVTISGTLTNVCVRPN
jgi:hypothetical protein